MVDYSKFEHPYEHGNWHGEISVKDGNSSKKIDVEIQSGDDGNIPDTSKKTLEFFLNNYEKYKEALSETIFEYYQQCREDWGATEPDDSDYPEVENADALTKMYSLSYVLVHYAKYNAENTIGLLYDCTWDDEGIGIKMTGFDVVKIGTQGSQL